MPHFIAFICHRFRASDGCMKSTTINSEKFSHGARGVHREKRLKKHVLTILSVHLWLKQKKMNHEVNEEHEAVVSIIM